ncbi:MAG: hypothetical protein ACRDRI_25415 [Pseudonocardiaceae bacterium]
MAPLWTKTTPGQPQRAPDDIITVATAPTSPRAQSSAIPRWQADPHRRRASAEERKQRGSTALLWRRQPVDPEHL